MKQLKDRKESIDIDEQVQVLKEFIQKTWKVGPDIERLIKRIYEVTVDFNKYNYDWSVCSAWLRTTKKDREKTLTEAWGEKHAKAFLYVDHITVFLRNVNFSDFAEILSHHRDDEFENRFLQGARYQEFKKEFTWLKRAEPKKLENSNVDQHDQIDQMRETFDGFNTQSATTPDFIFALDASVIRDYNSTDSENALCRALFAYWDAIYKHNHTLKLINELTRIGINNNNIYPMFTNELKSENPFVQVLTEFALSKNMYQLQDPSRPEVQHKIAAFLNDPQGSEPLLNVLRPFMDVPANEIEIEDFIARLDASHAAIGCDVSKENNIIS